MNSVTSFRLPRSASTDIAFDGALLAEQSSWETGKTHWQEVRVYRTTNEKWVVERVGRTTVHGQRDKSTVTVCGTPAEVRTALHSEAHGRVYLTDLCHDVALRAAEVDVSLREVLVERI